MPCAFFYNDSKHNRGVSSTTEWCIGAKAKLHQLLSRGKVIGDCATGSHRKVGNTQLGYGKGSRRSANLRKSDQIAREREL